MNANAKAFLPLADFPNLFHVPSHEAIEGSAVKFELSERLVHDWKQRTREETVGGADAEHIENWKEREEPCEPVREVARLFFNRLRSLVCQRFVHCLHSHVASLAHNFWQ